MDDEIQKAFFSAMSVAMYRFFLPRFKAPENGPWEVHLLIEKTNIANDG